MLKRFLPLAAIIATAPVHAQTLSYTEDGGFLSSVIFDEIMVEATASTTGPIGLIVIDQFPELGAMRVSAFDGIGLSFQINGIEQTVGAIEYVAYSLPDFGGVEAEGLLLFSFEHPVELLAGNIVTISGTSSLMLLGDLSLGMPISGAIHEAILVDLMNDRPLSAPFSVSAIPEPSTYALMFGAATLGGVLLRRSRRKR